MQDRSIATAQIQTPPLGEGRIDDERKLHRAPDACGWLKRVVGGNFSKQLRACNHGDAFLDPMCSREMMLSTKELSTTCTPITKAKAEGTTRVWVNTRGKAPKPDRPQ